MESILIQHEKLAENQLILLEALAQSGKMILTSKQAKQKSKQAQQKFKQAQQKSKQAQQQISEQPQREDELSKSKREYVYMLRTREFIRLNENVYKIGRTSDVTRRFGQYPKESEIIWFCAVDNSMSVEKTIKKFFSQIFKRTSYGHEWFEGDPTQMIEALSKIVSESKSDTSCKASPVDEIPDSEDQSDQKVL